MKTLGLILICAAISGAGALPASAASATSGKPAKAPATAKSKVASASVPQPKIPVVLEIPKSVFVVPANPREGRNPFFPGPSEQQKQAGVTRSDAPEKITLVLNGLSGPPKRMAMINGKSLERGEKSEIRLGDGSRVYVECIEIRDDGVLINVNGQPRELRLRNH